MIDKSIDYGRGRPPPGDHDVRFSGDLKADEAELVRLSGVYYHALEAVVAISDRSIGVQHTGRQMRALMVYAKMISHGLSLHSIVQGYFDRRELLDHFSVAVLARAILDAGLMTLYISHPTLTTAEWNLRRHILFLHDLVNRKRFLTSIEGRGGSADPLPFFENYEELKTDLRSKIAAFAASLGRSDAHIVEFQKGQLVFVDGSRAAAREAGWDVEIFDHMQSYWSAYVHSHPVSFLLAVDRGLSFEKPSLFQVHFVGVILSQLVIIFEDVRRRMDMFAGSIAKDPLGQID
ncbi:MAG: hypothetical protein M9939_18970 [Mesorhizobium sp.]|nr:hypothetical protein [Mesorhizobium sp.]MCO5163220.1 hypothetical protein [Mesorhizobium sp.]